MQTTFRDNEQVIEVYRIKDEYSNRALQEQVVWGLLMNICPFPRSQPKERFTWLYEQERKVYGKGLKKYKWNRKSDKKWYSNT